MVMGMDMGSEKEGQHGHGNESQLPVDDQHAGENADDGERFPDRVDEAVGHGGVDGVGVGGDPGVDV